MSISSASLKQQGAKITVWGVGTKLATGGDQPALGGVYKLSALKNAEGRWEPRIKRSEQAAKSSVPGIQQVRRYFECVRPVRRRRDL
jgi:nicotinate phosphoribosyltransferase